MIVDERYHNKEWIGDINGCRKMMCWKQKLIDVEDGLAGRHDSTRNDFTIEDKHFISTVVFLVSQADSDR